MQKWNSILGFMVNAYKMTWTENSFADPYWWPKCISIISKSYTQGLQINFLEYRHLDFLTVFRECNISPSLF